MRAGYFLGYLGIAGIPIAAREFPIGSARIPEPPSRDPEAPPYREELLSFHRSLVSVPSVTGTEGEVGKILLDYLASHSYTTRTQSLQALNNTPSDSGRFNVLAWPGSNPSPRPRLLVTSHLDVVPPYFPYHIDADSPADAGPYTLISGRGSVDAKASIVAQVTALDALLATGEVDRDDVMLLFVGGEESSGDGMTTFSDSQADLGLGDGFESVIFGEPTDNKLACGHKGIAFCKIGAVGKAGHSGYPWLGKSATEVLIKALARILDTDLGSSERFGVSTVNVGVLEGGVAPNVIPERASAWFAIRLAAGDQETGFDIARGRVEEILRDVDEEALDLECVNGYGPIKCDCDVDGFDTMIANYGTDIANLDGDHVRYLYGPGSILVAHGDDEALRVRDLEGAVEGYKKLIKHALGTHRPSTGELKK